MAEALNAEGRDGWEFQRSETIDAPVKRGFLSKARPETLSVLVFRRWVVIDGAQAEHPFEPAMEPAYAPTPEETFEMHRVPDPEPYDDVAPEQTQPRAPSLFARRDDTSRSSVPPLRAPDRD